MKRRASGRRICASRSPSRRRSSTRWSSPAPPSRWSGARSATRSPRSTPPQVQAIAPVAKRAGLINGRAPGVVMVAGSGAVGSGPRFRIRGASSLSLSDQPLVYIDGVRVANDISTGPQHAVLRLGRRVAPQRHQPRRHREHRDREGAGRGHALRHRGEQRRHPDHHQARQGRTHRVQRRPSRQGANWFNDAQERIGYNYNRNPVTGAIRRWSAGRAGGGARPPSCSRPAARRTTTSALNGGSEQVRYFLSSGYENDQGIEPTNDLWR